MPANTRWNSVCMTYERILQVIDKLDKISIKERWPRIMQHKAYLEQMTTLLNPFLK